MKKVLITGVTGFVGRHLYSALKDEFKVIPVSRIDIPNLPRIFGSKEPQVVINCIGILRGSAEDFRFAHVELVKNLLDLSVSYGVSRFIHFSALGCDKNEKSIYHRTKLEGENLIRESGLSYAILRPSIILGDGQKLYDDLKFLSSFLPILFAPKMKVQPVSIEKVVETVKREIFETESKVIELCGEEIISMAELFRRILKELNIKRPVIELPKAFFFPVALLGIGRMDMNAYHMIEDNICS
jgi:NADH dehydrogenase